MAAPRRTRDRADLERAIRALADHFRTDTVVVIGSQAILAAWADAPPEMRTSPEIDAYPGNARSWELANPGMEASEEINALFGEGSQFHQTHGFYIDGVDDSTAKLPPDWRDRAIVIAVAMLDGRQVEAIAPSVPDTVVAKLHRLEEKDRVFIRACHQARPLDLERLRRLMASCCRDERLLARASAFLDDLAASPSS